MVDSPFKGGAWIPPMQGSREERDAARRTVVRQARRLHPEVPVERARQVLEALGLLGPDVAA